MRRLALAVVLVSLSPPALAGEPGQRLSVSGVVHAADGHTPVARASICVYQADARGYYRPDDALGNLDPRLKGLLRSDASGRYSLNVVLGAP